MELGSLELLEALQRPFSECGGCAAAVALRLGAEWQAFRS